MCGNNEVNLLVFRKQGNQCHASQAVAVRTLPPWHGACRQCRRHTEHTRCWAGIPSEMGGGGGYAGRPPQCRSAGPGAEERWPPPLCPPRRYCPHGQHPLRPHQARLGPAAAIDGLHKQNTYSSCYQWIIHTVQIQQLPPMDHTHSTRVRSERQIPGEYSTPAWNFRRKCRSDFGERFPRKVPRNGRGKRGI